MYDSKGNLLNIGDTVAFYFKGKRIKATVTKVTENTISTKTADGVDYYMHPTQVTRQIKKD